MAEKDLTCAACGAELLLAGDEEKGDEVFCAYCKAPHRLTASASSDDCEAEEDF